MEKRIKLRRIIGIVLVALSLGAISFWEFWGRENITYDSVAVLRNSISENTIITEAMLKERKVNKAGEGAILFSDIDRIIGLESKQFIPQGAELYSEFFGESKLQTGESNGKFVMTVPLEWVVSYPQTVKRGDSVSIYGNGRLLTSCIVSHARDGSNQEVSYDEERMAASAAVNLIEIIVDEEQAGTIMDYIRRDDENRMVLIYQ